MRTTSRSRSPAHSRISALDKPHFYPHDCRRSIVGEILSHTAEDLFLLGTLHTTSPHRSCDGCQPGALMVSYAHPFSCAPRRSLCHIRPSLAFRMPIATISA